MHQCSFISSDVCEHQEEAMNKVCCITSMSALIDPEPCISSVSNQQGVFAFLCYFRYGSFSQINMLRKSMMLAFHCSAEGEKKAENKELAIFTALHSHSLVPNFNSHSYIEKYE